MTDSWQHHGQPCNKFGLIRVGSSDPVDLIEAKISEGASVHSPVASPVGDTLSGIQSPMHGWHLLEGSVHP